MELGTSVPYVGELSLPVSLYAEEKGGVYLAGAAIRMEEVVAGIAFAGGDQFNSDFRGRAELAFQADLQFSDTFTVSEVPALDESDTVPVRIYLHGDGGGLIAVESYSRLKATPVYLILATERNGTNYGFAFRWNTFDGWLDYSDTLTPVLRPSGGSVYSESQEWDVGIALHTVIEGGEIYSNKYVTTLRGNELGGVFGIQKQKDGFDWGFSLEQTLGTNILRDRYGRNRRGGLPRIVELNTQDLEVDGDARILKGDMTLVLGYDELSVAEGETSELLRLPPRSVFRGGIQTRPGNWIIDASGAMAKTWGKGTSETFFGTGFGYNFHIPVQTKRENIDWVVPVRFGQAIFYRITKIDEVPIYTIPGLFFGLSTTLAWKGLELDLSVRANTTTAFFANYAAAVDPAVPDLGIFNYLSAGAAIDYAF